MSTQPTSWLGIPGRDIQSMLPIIGGLAGMFPTATNTSGTGTTTNTSDIGSILSSLAQLTGASSTAGTGTTTTGYGSAGQALINTILPSLNSLVSRSTNLAPYTAQQTGLINRNANIASQAANNIMAARGLAGSPVAATTAANIGANRIGQITNLQQSIPLLQQQLQSQNMGTAANILAALPKTTTQAQTQTGTTSQNQSNMQTGATNSVGSTSTSQQQQQKSGGGVGGFIGGLGSILAHLFG